MSSPDANPLAEANPNSLDELFSRDPLGLQDVDLAIIVKELRRQREAWKLAEANGKTSAPKAKPAAKAKPGANPKLASLSAEDLDI